jgi:hypothetical protein
MHHTPITSVNHFSVAPISGAHYFCVMRQYLLRTIFFFVFHALIPTACKILCHMLIFHVHCTLPCTHARFSALTPCTNTPTPLIKPCARREYSTCMHYIPILCAHQQISSALYQYSVCTPHVPILCMHQYYAWAPQSAPHSAKI